MDDGKLLRALRSIGMTSFVEYYALFEDPILSKEEKVDRLAKLNGLSATGNKTRVSCASRIFRAEREKDALKFVVASKLPETTIDKAKRLLSE